MIDLTNVVAISVDGDGSRYDRISRVISAMRCHIQFRDIKVFSKDRRYASQCTWIKRACKSLRDYNRICLFEMTDHVDAEYCMIFHNDGFPLFPQNWTDQFLSVDYIGAPWENSQGHNWTAVNSVGNGGFSIRSKNLLDLVQRAARKIGRRASFNNEDGFICLTLRDHLENNGCVFADYELARRFSIETLLQGEGLDTIMWSFGFHDHNKTIISLLEESYGSIYNVPDSIFSTASG